MVYIRGGREERHIIITGSASSVWITTEGGDESGGEENDGEELDGEERRKFSRKFIQLSMFFVRRRRLGVGRSSG